MKMRIVLAALALLALAGVGNANGAAPAPADCCEKEVTTKKVVGYRHKMVRVPIYKTEKKRVKVECVKDCEPVKVNAGPGVDIPSPPPAVVIQNQEVLVITRPIVKYAPVPPVRILPAPQVVYDQPTLVRAPPPPMVQVVRAPTQCRPVAVTTCNGCQPVRTACARPGYDGPATAQGTAQQTAALVSPGGGYIAGAPLNAEECIARGGQLANEGRGCADYR